MKRSIKIAVCGLVSALSISLMFLSAVIPASTYACPALAGIVLVVLMIEFGPKWALSAYAATALVTFFLVPDKEAVINFVMFLGFYPILKGMIERPKSKILQWILKFALFNVCIIAAFLISVNILSIPKESFNVGGVYLPSLFLLVGNAVFLLYDLALTRVVSRYIKTWRKKLKFDKK